MGLTNSQLSDNQTNNLYKICAMEIHIGELIKQKAKEKNKSISDLADDINTGRRNMYQILDKNDMLISQLWKVSRSLQHNFFQEFNPITYHKDEEGKPQGKTAAKKTTSQEFTLKFEVKYQMEDADKLGAFVMAVNEVGEKLGFSLV